MVTMPRSIIAVDMNKKTVWLTNLKYLSVS